MTAKAVSNAVAYLRRTLPGLRSAVSLGWGVLGLRSHDACPAEAIDWLSAGHERCAGRPDAALGLALLLLASSDRALELLGAGSGGAAHGEPVPQAAHRAGVCHRDRSTQLRASFMNRRTFLTGVGATVASGLAAKLAWDWDEAGLRARVFIAKAASYDRESRGDHRGRTARAGARAGVGERRGRSS